MHKRENPKSPKTGIETAVVRTTRNGHTVVDPPGGCVHDRHRKSIATTTVILRTTQGINVVVDLRTGYCANKLHGHVSPAAIVSTAVLRTTKNGYIVVDMVKLTTQIILEVLSDPCRRVSV